MPALPPEIWGGLMYGKLFASAFTGSMFGAGPDVFAVWAYVVANAVEGTVELNPGLLGAILGTTADRVAAAIDRLCQPDAHSRSPLEQGRRLVLEGGFQYRVVNHAHYRAMRNEDDRRAYNREAKRRERAKSNGVKRVVNDSQRMSSMSAHTEAEAETEASTSTEGTATRDRSASNARTARARESAEAPAVTVTDAEGRALVGGVAWAVRGPRGATLVGDHRRCVPVAAEACGRGLCVPAFLVSRWAVQLGGPTPETDETIRAFVAAALARLTPGPVGDDPKLFWTAAWEAAHGRQAFAGGANARGRGIDTLDAAKRVLARRQSRREGREG